VTVYSDDFSAVDASKWSFDGSTVASGRLEIPPSGGGARPWFALLCPHCDWAAGRQAQDGQSVQLFPTEELQAEMDQHLLDAHS